MCHIMYARIAGLGPGKAGKVDDVHHSAFFLIQHVLYDGRLVLASAGVVVKARLDKTLTFRYFDCHHPRRMNLCGCI